MSDITRLLQQIGVKTSYFSAYSRYRNLLTKTMTGKDGHSIVYLERRIVPPGENFVVVQEHTVSGIDRLDNISNQYLGDPERFWQICDANNVLDPDELTANPGDKIKITLPEGIPG